MAEYCRKCNLLLLNLLEIDRKLCRSCQVKDKPAQTGISSAPIKTGVDCKPILNLSGKD